MLNSKVIGGIVIVLIVLAAIFVWKTLPRSASTAPSTQQEQQVAPQAVATSTYATSTYSIVYPSNFTVSDSYEYTNVNPKKPIHGVKFTIPMTMATGTNLSSVDTGISVEQLPRAKKCTGDIYLAANVHPTTVTDNGVTYSVASSSEGAAGSFFDETVYALPDSSPCTAVRYFIHSSDIGNYPPGTITAFDSAALLSAFDSIRRSLVLGSTPAPTTNFAPPTTSQ